MIAALRGEREHKWLIFIDQCSSLESQWEMVFALHSLAKACKANIDVRIADTHHGYSEKTGLAHPAIPIHGFNGRSNNSFRKFNSKHRGFVEFHETKGCHQFREKVYDVIDEQVLPVVEAMKRHRPESRKDLKVGGKSFKYEEVDVLKEDLIDAVYKARKHLGEISHKKKEDITLDDVERAISERRPKSIQIVKNAQRFWNRVVVDHINGAKKDLGEKTVLEQMTKFAADSGIFVTFVSDDTDVAEGFRTHMSRKNINVPAQCVGQKKFKMMCDEIVRSLVCVDEKGETITQDLDPKSPEAMYRNLKRRNATLGVDSAAARSPSTSSVSHPRLFDPVKLYVNSILSALGLEVSMSR